MTTKATKEKTIKEWFKGMDVGDIVEFPLAEFNYNTIRSTPVASLFKEMHEGKRWRTRADAERGSIFVTRYQ